MEVPKGEAMPDRVISDTEWAASLLRFIEHDVLLWKSKGFTAKTMFLQLQTKANKILCDQSPVSRSVVTDKPGESQRFVELFGLSVTIDPDLTEPYKIVEY